MKTEYVIGIFVAAIIIVGAAALLSKPASAETIKIGFIGPLTGEVANLGIDAKNGVELAVEEVNRQGGINGKPLQIIYEDGKCNAKDAAEAGNKLINADGVELIFGGLCSGETLAIAPIAEQNKVVLVSFCSSAPKVSQAGDYTFRVYPSDAFQGKFAAEYVYNTLGIRKVALLNTIGDWGTGLKDQFKSRFVELGGSIVAEESFEQTATDMRTQLTKIKSANPELVYMPAYTQGTSLILKQAKELGLNAIMFGGDGSDDPAVIENAGNAAEGFMLTVATPGIDEFKTRFKSEFGKDVIVCSSYGYDAVHLLAEVLKRAENGEAIKNELYKATRNGVTGAIAFDANGDRTSADYIIKKVEDGKFATVDQNKPASAKSVKIGFIGPLTGDVAQLGIPASQAVELAVEEVNKEGKIKIQLIKEDGGCNPRDANNAATKLTEVDKVVAIVGGFCSGETLAAAPIAERNKVVLFSGTSSNPAISQAGDYIFRSYPSDAFQGSFAAEYAFNNRSARKAAILYINNEWGTGIKATFRSRFAELGGQIVAEESFEQGAKDMRTQLTKIKAANPDFIYFPAHPAESIIVLREARELGLNATMFFGGDGAEDQTVASALNATGEGFMWVVSYTNPPQDFIDKITAKTGSPPSLGVAQDYDNLKILAKIIGETGADGEAIKNELYKVRDYPGVSGSITLDSNGDLVNAQYQLRIIRNGTMENA